MRLSRSMIWFVVVFTASFAISAVFIPAALPVLQVWLSALTVVAGAYFARKADE